MKIATAALVLVLVAFVDTAGAATLIYFDDLASTPSINQGVTFGLTLQADGSVTGQLGPGATAVGGMARNDLHLSGNNAFGLNLAPGVTATVRPNRFFPVWVPEFNGVVGPYGVFDFVLDGRSDDTLQTLIFTRAGGFSSVLDPFEENGAGIFAGIHVHSNQTGEDGFLAADLDVNPTLVPEPGSMLLLGTGLLAVARSARKRYASRTGGTSMR